MASPDIENECAEHVENMAIDSEKIKLDVVAWPGGKAEGNLMEEVPFEILQRCLIFVPDDDLLNKCVVVSKLWQEAIEDQSFWKEKCMLTEDWREFYFKSPFNRNLVKNCSGQDSLSATDFPNWEISSNGGQHWIVQTEDVPPGSGPYPEEVLQLNGGKPACFATSYGWCEKEQLIDLVDAGFSHGLLDDLKPDIFISEWYAPRFDCGNVYEFGVRLLKDRPQPGMDEAEMDTLVIDSFHFGPLQSPQWADKNWKQATHTFKEYGPGLRFIQFWHKSKDSQFWAGHYGGKMAGAEVRFLIGSKEPVQPSPS